MLANNETGIVQPVAAAVQIVHAAGAHLHVDAVQAAGRIPCHLSELGADLVTVSGHKLGGPKGAGALLVRRGLRFDPMLVGGAQERARRGWCCVRIPMLEKKRESDGGLAEAVDGIGTFLEDLVRASTTPVVRDRSPDLRRVLANA